MAVVNDKEMFQNERLLLLKLLDVRDGVKAFNN